MTNTKCTNCGLPIGKMGVLSPTLDLKRRNQCPKCAREFMTNKQQGDLIEMTWEAGIKEGKRQVKEEILKKLPPQKLLNLRTNIKGYYGKLMRADGFNECLYIAQEIVQNIP